MANRDGGREGGTWIFEVSHQGSLLLEHNTGEVLVVLEPKGIGRGGTTIRASLSERFIQQREGREGFVSTLMCGRLIDANPSIEVVLLCPH